MVMTTLLFPAQGVQIIGTCMSLTTPGFGGFTLILFIKLAASVMPRAHVFIVRSILPVHTKMLKTMQNTFKRSLQVCAV